MKIAIVGSGKVANFFSHFFVEKGITILQICSRNEETGKDLAMQCHANFITDQQKIDTNIDAILLAIPDDALGSCMITTSATVVHCSGSIDTSLLLKYSKHVGNIWPIFSISQATSLHVQNIPIVLQYQSLQAKEHVEMLANCISNQTQSMDLIQKQAAHLAATISNNFSNHLYAIAYQICQQHQLPFAMLLPMLQQSVAQLHMATPMQNQTGPAIRNDHHTLESHRAFLKNNSDTLELYNIFTKLIQQQFASSVLEK
jgi:predicted short-subunit dehydrogenase-like oxidoreductase (DUF2520 family)